MADRPASHVIPAAAARRVRWRNDAGWTNEIHVEPSGTREGQGAGDIGWSWRLSVAEIDRDAAFSLFPGVERELVLLSGNGMRLCFEDGEQHALAPPHGRIRFAGERALRAELVDGPTRDFNLMWRREHATVQLWHRPLVGPMVVFVDPGSIWVIHMLAGSAHLSGPLPATAMSIGDSALLRAGDGRTRHLLEGGGEALLIRIDPP